MIYYPRRIKISIIKFKVPGPPGYKGRHRYRRVGAFGIQTYTDAKTKEYEDQVRAAAAEHIFTTRWDRGGQYIVTIDAYFKPPKSRPKVWQKLAASGIIRPTKKPDWDNIGKVICDALNGYLWRDDSMVVTGIVNKIYSANPRVEVQVENIKDKRDRWTK